MKLLSSAIIDTDASLVTATLSYSPTLLGHHTTLDSPSQQQQQQHEQQQPRRSVFLDYSSYRLAEIPRDIP
ncbi:hypothetical protein GGI05_001855, partial [Coemansia sp. RSA 2603]